MTWLPVLSSLFTRAAWRDICWLNDFLQANCRKCAFGDVFWEGGCLKDVSPKRQETTEFTRSGIVCCHISHFNGKPSICSLGQKTCQNVSVETMDLSLVPQKLDFTVSLIPVLSHFQDFQRVMINPILISPFLNKILEKKKVFFLQASKEALLHLAAEVQVGQRFG